jgi:hypothetical protein
MQLRTQVGLGVSVVVVVAAVLVFGVVSPQLTRTFLDIERVDVLKNVDRARNALATELIALEATAHDWAAWDETVRFAEGAAPGFADENLFAETLTNLRLNGWRSSTPRGGSLTLEVSTWNGASRRLCPKRRWLRSALSRRLTGRPITPSASPASSLSATKRPWSPPIPS